ncbi:hypothetical protein CHS0354_033750 [Potamilus streckersoni]|uniref:Vacuolar protein sorting-associated protein VTA1 homolog n=1 Tax=Potamilus streckersoni TaxID=2493646 RepID=A0AAE0S244_9BIVA|nr:hypothetical protein CHS0354_033750 [Potamilus streckersoni]
MSFQQVPQLPPALKQLQHYLKTAVEHDKRDPVIAYYCRLYTMQSGMQIDKKSPDCRKFLVALMDYLEQSKKSHSIEAIHNEVVGQAHVENYALKVFLYADNEDRAGRFNKNVVKSFYTAGMLFDVLSVFGEISEDIEKNRKYAKWKAAYIHKCLKNGETPIPGPMPEEGGDEAAGGVGSIGFESHQPQPGPSYHPSSSSDLPTPNQYPIPGTHAPPTTPQEPPEAKPAISPRKQPTQPITYNTNWIAPTPTGVTLTPAHYQKALKLCKYASSALQYEDSQTAVENLSKALSLLTTGKEE